MVIKHDVSVAGGNPEVGAFSIAGFVIWSGISRSQVYVEFGADRLLPYKVGRRTFISKPEAERWREELPRYVVRKPRPKPLK